MIAINDVDRVATWCGIGCAFGAIAVLATMREVHQTTVAKLVAVTLLLMGTGFAYAYRITDRILNSLGIAVVVGALLAFESWRRRHYWR